jgi:hypothetical protein
MGLSEIETFEDAPIPPRRTNLGSAREHVRKLKVGGELPGQLYARCRNAAYNEATKSGRKFTLRDLPGSTGVQIWRVE